MTMKFSDCFDLPSYLLFIFYTLSDFVPGFLRIIIVNDFVISFFLSHIATGCVKMVFGRKKKNQHGTSCELVFLILEYILYAKACLQTTVQFNQDNC